MALYQCITKCFHNGVLCLPGDVISIEKDYPAARKNGRLAHFLLIDDKKQETEGQISPSLR